MLLNKKEIHIWKIQQIEYFKEYLNNFNTDSKEYMLIKNGIDKLESSLLEYSTLNN